MPIVGAVREIWRYPVKSMAGERLPTATIGWHGVAGDRRYALRKLGDGAGFPWLSASRLPALVRHRAYEPPSGRVRVVTPDGRDVDGDDADLRARLSADSGVPVELFRLNHGVFDEAPISVIAYATIRRLCEAAGVPVDVRRFRPNLVVDTVDGAAFSEDAWVGRTLACGEHVQLAVTQPDLRCAMVNLDPDTAEAQPTVLVACGVLHRANAGVYAAPFRVGPVAVGDPVSLA